MRIAHEAIYQALYIHERGALQRDITSRLHTGRALRVPRARSRGRGKQFVTPDVALKNRPAEVMSRDVPGHWEGDLIVGLESSSIGTLVERVSRYTMLRHLPRMSNHGQQREKRGPALAGHGAGAVREAITAALRNLPAALRKTLTWDQGAEMAQHVALRRDTGLGGYSCEPHSPWQRGSNENVNGLLHQYFPKEQTSVATKRKNWPQLRMH
jgi:IS30 family transposase